MFGEQPISVKYKYNDKYKYNHKYKYNENDMKKYEQGWSNGGQGTMPTTGGPSWRKNQ